MKHISTTPFRRRTISAGQTGPAAVATHACSAASADKWALLRELGTARRAFGVSDRDLTVLQALLSFLPGQELREDLPMIVFPSNARLRERLHDMPESTLRRHIAALVSAGLMQRHDSPNGKRFARRTADGSLSIAFGFDLRTLLVRSTEIFAQAANARAALAECTTYREELVLRLRNFSCIADDPEHISFCDDLRRALRRKLTIDQMQAFMQRIQDLQAMYDVSSTTKTGANDSQNERHIQHSNINQFESKKEAENGSEKDVEISLETVLEAFPDCQAYEPGKITTWAQFVALAYRLCPMMGISPAIWQQAQAMMGVRDAAISVAGVLQMFARIRSPGAYMRSLMEKARKGQYRPTPMIRASLARLQAAGS